MIKIFSVHSSSPLVLFYKICLNRTVFFVTLFRKACVKMYTEQNILCFITAADVLNISQAAEILYMSRQAVSQQIKNLETSLNATLFERVNNKLTLTAAGKAYLCEFTAFQKKISVLNTKFYAPDEGTLPIRIGIMETLRPWKQITHFRKYCEEHGLSPEIQYSVFSPNLVCFI